MGALTEAFDFVKRWAVVALLIIPCPLALQIAKVEAELAEAKLSAATERTDREIAARLHEANLAKREQTHATKQQEKEDDYSAEKLALEKRVAAERAASNSLRTQLASATARANAGSATDPVACERAFNRLEELGGLAGEGAGLLQEARELLRERDTDIRRLFDQLTIDREAFGQAM